VQHNQSLHVPPFHNSLGLAHLFDLNFYQPRSFVACADTVWTRYYLYTIRG